MVLAIRLSRAGGPEVLVPETMQRSELGPNGAWIVQEADVMQRQGTGSDPHSWRVEGVGSGPAPSRPIPRNVAVGDRVGYERPGGPCAQARGLTAKARIERS
jgi:hypothetical protein